MRNEEYRLEPATQTPATSEVFHLLHVLFSALPDLSDKERLAISVEILGTNQRTLAFHREQWSTYAFYADIHRQSIDAASSEEQQTRLDGGEPGAKDVLGDPMSERRTATNPDRWAWWIEVVRQAAEKLKIDLRWVSDSSIGFAKGDASKYQPKPEEHKGAVRAGCSQDLVDADPLPQPLHISDVSAPMLDAEVRSSNTDWHIFPLLADSDPSEDAMSEHSADELEAEDYIALMSHEPGSEAGALLDGLLAREQQPDVDYGDIFKVLCGKDPTELKSR